MFDRCGGSGDRGVVGDWYEMRRDGMLRWSVSRYLIPIGTRMQVSWSSGFSSFHDMFIPCVNVG